MTVPVFVLSFFLSEREPTEELLLLLVCYTVNNLQDEALPSLWFSDSFQFFVCQKSPSLLCLFTFFYPSPSSLYH